MQAIRIIRDEHRALAAILHGMLYLVGNFETETSPNFDVFGAMIYYIDAFPERFHHPKEDRYLFRVLRIRHPDAAPLLDRLEGEALDRRPQDPNTRAGAGALSARRCIGISRFRQGDGRLCSISLEPHAR